MFLEKILYCVFWNNNTQNLMEMKAPSMNFHKRAGIETSMFHKRAGIET
jgi:hypothetical protein